MDSQQKNLQLNIFNKESKPTLWQDVLAEEKKQPYFQAILKRVATEREQGNTIYPQNSEIFNALKSTEFEDVKVVIIGQDPYHGPGQAHGLCFSVKNGVRTPPSLKNIFKELHRDLGMEIPDHGNLQPWTEQGVLLLNAVLTVQHKQAGSHANIGWEQFTDKIISILNQQREKIVFLLWGNYAQKKGTIIDRNKHLVLSTTHPSPFSAHRGFLGSGHFSACNRYLAKNGIREIKWEI